MNALTKVGLDASVTNEKSISKSVGGRTVFDDLGKPWGKRASRQLSLLAARIHVHTG